MTNLKLFDIGSNEMSYLDPRIFLNSVNFEEINLFRNNFDDAQAIMNLLNGHLGMRRIFIHRNRFPMFSFDFFRQFGRLEELAVGELGNSTGIAWQALPATLTSLAAYDVGENIPENAFFQLQRLKFLDISGAGITVLQKDTFKEQRNLEWLFVMDTRIKTIHPELFVSQGNLRVLYFNWNEIEEIPAGALVPLVNLGFNASGLGLHFYSNKIQRLSSQSFGHHPYLNRIDFTFNQIMEIDRQIFSRLSPMIAYAGFWFNNCTSVDFWNATNLEDKDELQYCFNNYDGIPTTTPNSGEKIFGKIEIVVIFVGFLRILSILNN
jgi:Leucine-rich repeat (LRR) protein